MIFSLTEKTGPSSTEDSRIVFLLRVEEAEEEALLEITGRFQEIEITRFRKIEGMKFSQLMIELTTTILLPSNPWKMRIQRASFLVLTLQK